MIKILFRFTVLLLLITSCSNRQVYDKNFTIPGNVWNADNYLQFDININDTSSINNIYLNIRNNNSYPYKNLYLFVSLTDPGGRYKRDTVEVIMARDNGKWLGKGIGDVFAQRIPLLSNVKFEYQGIYTFEFEQAMRKKELEGLLDIGIRIEKIK